MPKFGVCQTSKLNLTSYSGLALIGQCCEAAQVDSVIDPRLPVSQGMKTSDLVKAMVGLLSLGKSDFEAIEPFRTDRFFKEVLGLSKVPSSAWMRQRCDAKASELRALTDELSVRLLERTEAPITPYKGYVRFEIDTFVMDNSDTKKEDVGRTYQGVDGYCPIAGYLGNEGWNVGLELRAGTWHCARQTEYFYERAFPRVKRLVKPEQAVLMVEDSGFDSARLLFAKAAERDAWAAEGRGLEFITKWNPRKQDKSAWVAQAEAAGVFQETRPGKRVGRLEITVERAWGKEKRSFRLIVEVTERTIDRNGQHLLAPEIELEGWWISLDLPAKEVIEHYQYHGTHEQFHAEIKSDLDLERLPSGKFDTNDCVLRLGAFAYNCLRLLGQLGLTGEIAPIRHPAKRRRLKTVLQEIMYRAAKFVAHARKRVLDFGRNVAEHVKVFVALQDRLWRAASP
ncbi:IS1380 family transposase [Thermochromatium tepidum]|uniref:IS1380 family transposase n=1 Tax=Thermochromatium tepidum ATCC 43061 TaxID=316276 RepID=A0A6I6E1T1_THETI|nr:IS1380 family transposase [Thermochromatium tepidum]QGU33921.1 IS1380 family transposase [Thermochromatium tepidum ATCC 43061]